MARGPDCQRLTYTGRTTQESSLQYHIFGMTLLASAVHAQDFQDLHMIRDRASINQLIRETTPLPVEHTVQAARPNANLLDVIRDELRSRITTAKH